MPHQLEYVFFHFQRKKKSLLVYLAQVSSFSVSRNGVLNGEKPIFSIVGKATESNILFYPILFGGKKKNLPSHTHTHKGLKRQMSSSLHMYFVYLYRLHFKDILLKDSN